VCVCVCVSFEVVRVCDCAYLFPQKELDTRCRESQAVTGELEALLARLDLEHKQFAAEKALLTDRIRDAQEALSEEELKGLDAGRELKEARSRVCQ